MRLHIHLICISIVVLLWLFFGVYGAIIGLTFSAYWLYSMKYFYDRFLPEFNAILKKMFKAKVAIFSIGFIFELVLFSILNRNNRILIALCYMSFLLLPFYVRILKRLRIIEKEIDRINE